MRTISGQKTSNLTRWAVKILTVLAILIFTPGVIMKVTQHPMVVEGFARVGIPQVAIVPLGLVELTCLALYLIPRTIVLGTLLLTGYLGGATAVNIIGGTDFSHALVVGLLVWAGAWFRLPELRTLIPVRRTKGASTSGRRWDAQELTQAS